MELPDIKKSTSAKKNLKSKLPSSPKFPNHRVFLGQSQENSKLKMQYSSDEDVEEKIKCFESKTSGLSPSPGNFIDTETRITAKTHSVSKLKYIINSIPSSLKERLNLPIIPTDHSYERIVSPVTYRNLTPSTGPSFQFSSSPRFDTPLLHQIEMFKYRCLSEDKKKEIKKRIKMNINEISRFTPVNHKEFLKLKFELKNSKALTFKENKLKFDLTNKKLRLDHYNSRLKRMEIRNN